MALSRPRSPARDGLFEPTDDELLAAARGGDTASLRRFLDRHESTVRGPLSWLIEDTGDCEDAVVEVIGHVLDSDEAILPTTQLPVLLTRKAIVLGDVWRRNHAAERTRQANALRERGQAGRPRPQDVVAALAELPTDFFVPLMLLHLESRPVDQIAQILGKATPQVWGMVHQALTVVDGTIRGVATSIPRRPAQGCDRVSILLALEDELSPKERERVTAHVDRCAECRNHEWRLSTLLAFLGTISGMARKREQASQTLERLSRRRGGRQLAGAAVLVRRAAVAIAAIGLVTVGIAGLIAAANRAGAGRVVPVSPAGPAVAAATDGAGGIAAGLGGAPSANPQAGTEPSPSQPALAGVAAAPAPGTGTAWLPLPEFQGSLTAPGRAAPAAAQAPSVAPSGQPVPGPTEPTEPIVALGNTAGGGADDMPTHAGWSRADRGSTTEGRTPPPPTTHAASPETGALGAAGGPTRSTVTLPGPPTVEIPKPVLPRILVGARGGEGASSAPPSSAGTSGAPGSGGGAGDTKSTLAALVDSVLGSHRGSRSDR